MKDTINDSPEEYKLSAERQLSVLDTVLKHIPWTIQLRLSILKKIEIIQRDRGVLIENKWRMLRWICGNARYRTGVDQSYNDFYLASVRGIDDFRERLENKKISEKS